MSKFGQRERDIFAKLELDYAPIAVKFCFSKPEGIEPVEADVKKPLCLFLKEAQETGKAFYLTVDNEDCMGRVVLGMKDLSTEASHACGLVGASSGAFRAPGANARLYYEAPRMLLNTVNYVVFCPVDKCDFTPDLVVCVADTPKALLLLRASSYTSGDLWESKCSYVMSCAWTYVYPYLSGKVNHLFTGMHMGLQVFDAYPAGNHIISIPYQKIDEVVDALYDMPWVPMPVDPSPEVRAEAEKTLEFMEKITEDPSIPTPLY